MGIGRLGEPAARAAQESAAGTGRRLHWVTRRVLRCGSLGCREVSTDWDLITSSYQKSLSTRFSYKPKMEDVLSPPVDRMCQALLFALGKVGARRPLPSRVTVLGRSLIPVSLAGQKKLGIELTKLWGSLAAPGSHPGCSGLTEPPISCGTETTLLPKLLRDPVACLPGHGGSRQQSSPSFPDAEQGYSSAVQEVATCH
ncbi:homeobox protein goosecoid-2 isoform X5 [Mycteria americana]